MLEEQVGRSLIVKRAGEVSVSDMMAVVARAYIATSQKGGSNRIRGMNFAQLVKEYHWAVVTLDAEGLLSEKEQQAAHSHAQDFLTSPAAASEG